ncbi:hypothetical protein EX30DRAFT_240803 [Ascodesmis nigricans]|uniref:Uncharacterized protein n=1 Tax=Ascodesmis nigricans TaxID=341454 RepID=A0A4V3SIZ9_9PEZI|nr:hypothetical protein EX30DRAFT_240803 [Ascodesmis nigricans]
MDLELEKSQSYSVGRLTEGPRTNNKQNGQERGFIPVSRAERGYLDRRRSPNSWLAGGTRHHSGSGDAHGCFTNRRDSHARKHETRRDDDFHLLRPVRRHSPTPSPLLLRRRRFENLPPLRARERTLPFVVVVEASLPARRTAFLRTKLAAKTSPGHHAQVKLEVWSRDLESRTARAEERSSRS